MTLDRHVEGLWLLGAHTISPDEQTESLSTSHMCSWSLLWASVCLKGNGRHRESHELFRRAFTQSGPETASMYLLLIYLALHIKIRI